MEHASHLRCGGALLASILLLVALTRQAAQHQPGVIRFAPSLGPGPTSTSPLPSPSLALLSAGTATSALPGANLPPSASYSSSPSHSASAAASAAASATPGVTHPPPPPPCDHLPATAGAAVYWPAQWPKGNGPPFYWPMGGPYPPKPAAAGPEETALHWRMELCRGEAALGALLSSLPKGSAGRRLLEPAERAWQLLFNSSSTALRCAGCAGVLQLTRLQGCVANGTQSPASSKPPLDAPSDDPLQGYAVTLGPDELFVTLEGAEFHALPAVHVGGCSYALPYAVTIPGPYRLYALALRADYAALDELTYAKMYPPFTLDAITGDKLLLHLGAVTPEEQASARASALDAGAGSPRAHLPPCSGHASLGEGRYVRRVPTSLNDTFAPAHPPYPTPEWPNGTILSYFVQLREEFEFVPYACRRPVAIDPQSVARRCFSSRRVDIRGDSHTRALFNHAMLRVCGIHNTALKGVQTSSCVDNSSGSPWCQDAFICLTPDPMGLGLDQALQDFDVVAVNFGQHLASQHRTPSFKYRESVARYFSNISGSILSQSGGVKLLWMENVPLCTSNSEWRHSWGDWRTHHRLMLYNEAAREALTRLPAGTLTGFVDLWRQTLPLSNLCYDTAHMIGVDNVLDAQLWSLLDGICPYWDSDA